MCAYTEIYPKSSSSKLTAFDNHTASSSCKRWWNQASANVSVELTLSEDGRRDSVWISSFLRGIYCPIHTPPIVLFLYNLQNPFRSFTANFEGRNSPYKALPTHSAILSSLPFSLSCFPLEVISYLMAPSGAIRNQTIHALEIFKRLYRIVAAIELIYAYVGRSAANQHLQVPMDKGNTLFAMMHLLSA